MASMNERKKINYDRLRAAGFSSKDAARLRSASEEKIQAAIRSGIMPEKDPTKITRGPAALVRPDKIEIPGISYIAAEDIEKKYLSDYSYIISYSYKSRYGGTEKEYITISSNRSMYKYEVIEAAREILAGNNDKYRYSQIKLGSITIEHCVTGADVVEEYNDEE